jgi:hypothetical protein
VSEGEEGGRRKRKMQGNGRGRGGGEVSATSSTIATSDRFEFQENKKGRKEKRRDGNITHGTPHSSSHT